MSSPVDDHRQSGEELVARCAVLTATDSRTLESDASGDLIQKRLENAGHEVVSRELVADDRGQIHRRLESWLDASGLDLIIATGGTGISHSDRTPEAVTPLLERELPGFGELFRRLSYDQIGSAAMLSRAVAGVHGDTAIFALPGSPKAVELAMDELIVPEIGHLLGLLRR